jgi:hypothetical protein
MDNATTGIRVSKNGAVMVDRNSATAPAHDDDGYYRVALSATDTNTLGTLLIQYEESGVCLPGWKEFMVVPANVWDSFFGADNLQVDMTQIVGGAVPTPTTTGVPDVNVERWLDTLVTLGAGAPDVNVASMDAGSIASGVIAAGELANIENEIWDALKSGHVIANSFGDFLDIEVSSRSAPATAQTITADQNVNVNQWLGAAAPALVGGRLDASVGAMAANVITAAAINSAALTAAKFGAGAIDANALATDAVNEIARAILPQINTAYPNIEFLFVAASDHVTPVTGATGTSVERSIDGGAFGAGTGTLTEVSDGIYQYDASAADMNGAIITFRFLATGGTPGAPDDRFVTIVTAA